MKHIFKCPKCNKLSIKSKTTYYVCRDCKTFLHHQSSLKGEIMLLQTINKDNEKIVWFDSCEPRYYKAYNNKLYYSDNLFQWKPASKRESIAIHIIKDELGLGGV